MRRWLGMLPIALAVLVGLVMTGFSPVSAGPQTQIDRLNELSAEFAAKWESYQTPQLQALLTSPSRAQAAINRNPDIQLIYINERGLPMALAVTNRNAAQTISSDDVLPGGIAGFNVDGSTTLPGEMAIWDAGGVLYTHVEFDGRVTLMDAPSSIHYHSTHCGGTMVASGVAPAARGMSPAAPLHSYDWDADNSEMASAAASGMIVSNHSYVWVAGWNYDSGENAWYWWGDINVDPAEDYGFGFYGSNSRDWDEIAYNAPYYSIVKGAGNDRNDNGPMPGGQHYFWDDTGWAASTAVRNPDGGTDGYDCLPWFSVAKNIICVGAVNDLTAGYTTPGAVSMSTFSSWGPTDDGRIKPDIVGNGVNLYSTHSTGAANYLTISGTSMASPNIAGSINLVYQHFEATHGGQTPLSSTVKALMVQTADEAGPNPGPDYMFGWGLMNTRHACEAATNDTSGTDVILERELFPGETHEFMVNLDGSEPLRVTIAWTDPPGNSPAAAIDPPDLMLVNDLDLRVEQYGSALTFEPWILDPANPADAAATGDNFRDNVEQVHIDSPDPGFYWVRVTHKGALTNGSQVYSLVSSSAENNGCCGKYTGGLTGNFDNSPDGVRDLNDVLQMASYAFLSGDLPPCLADGNADGDPECVVDLNDVLALASYAFLSGGELAPCDLECEL